MKVQAKAKKQSHLLGVFKMGEMKQAIHLARAQFEELVKRGELNKGENMAYVEIRVYLVDDLKEEGGVKVEGVL